MNNSSELAVKFDLRNELWGGRSHVGLVGLGLVQAKLPQLFDQRSQLWEGNSLKIVEFAFRCWCWLIISHVLARSSRRIGFLTFRWLFCKFTPSSVKLQWPKSSNESWTVSVSYQKRKTNHASSILCDQNGQSWPNLVILIWFNIYFTKLCPPPFRLATTRDNLSDPSRDAACKA